MVLAGGKPIVGTPIRSLSEFAHVIKLASTQSEWSRAVTESLAPDAISIDQIEKRRSIARQFDWETIVHDIARSMCNRLGPPYREQFSAHNPLSTSALGLQGKSEVKRGNLGPEERTIPARLAGDLL
jgi:hypothetical protein